MRALPREAGGILGFAFDPTLSKRAVSPVSLNPESSLFVAAFPCRVNDS